MLRALIIIFALGAGGLAAWIALSSRQGAPSASAGAPAAPPLAVTEVLVAAADVPQGKTLSDDNIRWQSWPKDSVNPGFITRTAKPDAVASFTGAIARSHFVAGEPIQADKVVQGSSSFLASILTPGMRAVAIRISVESTAGGFILPNDRVDVIHTVARPKDGQTDNLSHTILTNIRVLAVGQKAEQKVGEDDGEKGETTAMGKTATLELNPAQAEVIAAGQATGILSLSLRSVADSAERSGVLRPGDGRVRIMRAGQSQIVRF